MSVSIAPRTVLKRIAITTLLVLMVPVCAVGSPYRDYKSLRKHLASLAERNPDLVHLDAIARSLERRRVWMVQIGAGPEAERDHRPAMLVVAGSEGTDLAGSYVTVSWIERVLAAYEDDPEIARLLETTTIYVVPRLNPDAAERFFADPQVETSANTRPFDDDHDGLLDEDGPDDLNGDGLITYMRVLDGNGAYALDSLDDRLLVEADPLREQAAAWRYLTEGLDNDHDGTWNEDGLGGVHLDRNFPFDYDYLATHVGLHPVSENETRGLADFVIDHPNIGIVLTYGDADNLLECPESDSPPERRKPLTAIDEKDVGYYREMGKLFRESLGLDDELENSSHRGTFSDWMYFHRGRLSLAACPWSPEIAIARTEKEAEPEDPNRDEEAAENEQDETKEESDEDADEKAETERRRLEWFDRHAPEAFLAWQPWEHPDFPGRRVEIGGYRPFTRTNPPDAMLGDIAEKHAAFLTALLHKLPRLVVREVQVNHLGNAVFEITICLENTGFLPTVLSHGERTREVHPTRITLDIDDARFLSGGKITRLPSISGSGGTASTRYVVHLPQRQEVGFTVVSALAGQIRGMIELLEDQ